MLMIFQAEKASSQPDAGGAEQEQGDVSLNMYGERPLNQSQVKVTREVTRVADVNLDRADKTIWIRARLHTSRSKGKQCFVVLRQGRSTIQGIIAVGPQTSKQMMKFVSK
jgi:lysyl-tRNA synthetase class II